MRARIAAALALGGLALGGCAINPATGKRQFVLISEAQEIEMGRQNDRAITEQMGLYPDDALQDYVQDLGARLAARSERPRLDWSFRVVDDPVVNAFALPGGYIYVTRGILAHLESEAELVAVLGHEIGHVTARHSVSQLSKAQVPQVLLDAAAVLSPERTQQFGGLAQSLVGLLFLKYGRDDERQADDLGLRYAVAGGYDPRPMTGVFDMLGRVSAAAGGERLPGWASTHPAPENRRERTAANLSATGQDFSGRPVRREEYLRRIDGLVFGENPRDGYFEGSRFLHPELRFQFEFPPGWQVRNQRASVTGISNEQDALLQLTMSGESTASVALRTFLAREGVESTGPPMGAIGGLPTAGDGFSVTSERGSIRGRVGFVEYRGRVYRLLGYTVEAKWSEYEGAIRAALAGFRELTDPRALDVRPRRLELVRTTRSIRLDEVARDHEAAVSTEVLALINRVDPDALLRSGQTVKLVR